VSPPCTRRLVRFEQAGIGCAEGQRSAGSWSCRGLIYPTRGLRAYKQKFDPQCQTRWLAIPYRLRQASALIAIGRAYCEGVLVHAARSNL
jgi:hypothetical protein